MLFTIVFLPFLGFLVSGLFGDRLQLVASEALATAFVLMSALLSWIIFVQFLYFMPDAALSLCMFSWISSGSLQVDWALRLDMLTAVMLVVVNSVSGLVHVYSFGYMAHDPGRARFFAYLSLFTFAMLVLVTSDNLVQMFFGWEGVGLASYLLIGFWHTRISATNAAIKAFIVNRVGDFGFLLGILTLFQMFGTVEFAEIFNGVARLEGGDSEAGAGFLVENSQIDFLFGAVDALTLACLLLFMGAMGKSAQFLLHTWLPDAMEGPTPVSALIHAATMVTAGVFMVARLSPLFVASPGAMSSIVLVGAFTSVFAASIGLVQCDIKRVIAYSTCSQLGYMFAALGIGAFPVAIFHLFTHAFFKALLFLGAGSVIHAVSGEQDMRKMGGLKDAIPVTYWMMVIGTLALTGFPFTAGYFSKDAIIESLYAAHSSVGMFGFLATSFAALLTSFYSWRLIFMTFHGSSHVDEEAGNHVHESPAVMLGPLFILACGALLGGVVFAPLFIDGKIVSDLWRGAVSIPESLHLLEEMHHVPQWVAWTPFVAMTAGFVLSWMLYVRWPWIAENLMKRHPIMYRFLHKKWYFDELYDLIFLRPALWLGHVFGNRGDRLLIDGYGPDAVASRTLDAARYLSRVQSGYIYHYAFAMILGLAVLITWVVFRGGIL